MVSVSVTLLLSLLSILIFVDFLLFYIYCIQLFFYTQFVFLYLYFHISLKYPTCFWINDFFVIFLYYPLRLFSSSSLVMAKYTSVEKNWMQYIERQELIPYIFMAAWYFTSAYSPCYIMKSNNQQKKVVDFSFYCYSLPKGITV